MEQLLGIEYTAYVALAVLLFAIRQATGISNRYIPLTGVILGIAFAMLKHETFNYDVLLEGIRYALYGVGTVATIKYTFVKKVFDERSE
ncbi:hypothetical protein [Litchfieldia salsa]|uniref:Uncharacterized protein n=1 Tax=Litchfieldia salsa TaxID=930152 RepID=A0A1H0WR69_9BACI|nr:hypothetical protein [Litchfieldia salsa]SDP92965.1 hypothetical protein SAMN05216565_11399 [Litchfieldia salsa]